MSTPKRFEPPPADPSLLALLAGEGFGGDVFNERQHRSCTYVDFYVVELAIRLIDDLGVARELATARTVAELLVARRFAADFRGPLAWLLDFLADAGVLDAVGDAGTDARYRLSAPLPAADPASVREAGIAIDPSYAPTYAMLDQAAVAYGKIARGEDTAERALFQNITLWMDYFSNANGYYALNNRVAAAAAAARVRDCARVLEVGAGLGSAPEALIERLGTRASTIASYRATEPVPFFRRRAERALRARLPEVALKADALDLNERWAPQGVAAGSYDLVWGVNVFHLARRLQAVLAEALAALEHGGALVVGEGMRPFQNAPVAAEFPFRLLNAFVDVELDARRRPRAGFLTASQWRAALEQAGFVEVAVVPDVERMVKIRPGFYAAAVCGRHP